MEVHFIRVLPVKNPTLGFTQITLKLHHGAKTIKMKLCTSTIWNMCLEYNNHSRKGNGGHV